MFTSTTLNSRRQQRGITLIEVSIGLIIAAIIAAAAFIAFQNNARRTETQDNIKLITEVIAESKQKFGLTGGYGPNGSFDALAVQTGILEDVNQLNSYGGAINLVSVDAGENATLTWQQVEGDQCTDIVLNIADGVNEITGLGDPVIVVNGTITLDETTEICGDGNAEIPNLVMEFGRR